MRGKEGNNLFVYLLNVVIEMVRIVYRVFEWEYGREMEFLKCYDGKFMRLIFRSMGVIVVLWVLIRRFKMKKIEC